MVCQGTAPGPPFGNIYYTNVALALNVQDFLEIVFAFNLIASRTSRYISRIQSCLRMHQYQHDFYKWRSTNQVSFDLARESKHILILHLVKTKQNRLLGVFFDHSLSMRDALGEIVSEAVWEVASILMCSTCFFCHSEFVDLYKTQLFVYLEYRMAAS